VEGILERVSIRMVAAALESLLQEVRTEAIL